MGVYEEILDEWWQDIRDQEELEKSEEPKGLDEESGPASDSTSPGGTR